MLQGRGMGARREGVISKELCGFPDLNREGPIAGVGWGITRCLCGVGRGPQVPRPLRSCAGVSKAVEGRGRDEESRSLSP